MSQAPPMPFTPDALDAAIADAVRGYSAAQPPPPMPSPAGVAPPPAPSSAPPPPDHQPDPLDAALSDAVSGRPAAFMRGIGTDPASGYALQQIRNVEPESWFTRNISRPAASAFTGAVHATQAHLGLPVGESRFDAAIGGKGAERFLAPGSTQEGLPAEAARTVGGLAGSALDPATVAGMAVAGPAGRAVGAEAAPAIAALVESIGARAGPTVAAAAQRVLASVTGGAGGGAAFGGTQKASEIALSDPGRFLSDPEGVRDEILAAGGAGAEVGAGFGAVHGAVAREVPRGTNQPVPETKAPESGTPGPVRETATPPSGTGTPPGGTESVAPPSPAPRFVAARNPEPGGSPYIVSDHQEGQRLGGFRTLDAAEAAAAHWEQDPGAISPAPTSQEPPHAQPNPQAGPLHGGVRQEPRGDEGRVPAPEGRPGVPRGGPGEGEGGAAGAEGGVREPGAAEEAVKPIEFTASRADGSPGVRIQLQVRDGTAEVLSLIPPAGEPGYKPGTAELRSAFRSIQAAHPEIERFTGTRATGANAAASIEQSLQDWKSRGIGAKAALPPIPPSPALRAMLLPPLRELARAHGLDDAGGKGAVVDRLIAERGKAARAKASQSKPAGDLPSADVQAAADRGAAGGAVDQGVAHDQGQPRAPEQANGESKQQHRAPPESRNDTLPAQGASREAGTAAQRNGPDRLGDGAADPGAAAPGRGGEQPGGAAADGLRPKKQRKQPAPREPKKALDPGTRFPRPGEFSRPDIERRIVAATEGVPDDSRAAEAHELRGGEDTAGGMFTWAPGRDGKMPGELRDLLEGQPLSVRRLFKKAVPKTERGATGPAGFEEALGNLGAARILAEAQRVAGGKPGAVRRALDLVERGAPVGPEAHFLGFLHALLPEKAGERPQFGVLDRPHELPDGTSLEIGGRPFAVVHEGERRLLVEQAPDLDPDAEIGRGEVLAVDLRHLEALPVDRGTLERAAPEVRGKPESKPERSPVGREQVGQREGVFGQRVVDPGTGAQRGMFGDMAPQAPEQIVRDPGESERDYKARVANLTSPDPTQMGMFGDGAPKAAPAAEDTGYGAPGEAMGAAAGASFGSGPGLLRAIAHGAGEAVQRLRLALAGVDLPAAERASPELAQKLAVYASSGIEAQKAIAAHQIAAVMPGRFASEAARRKFGNALIEGQLMGLRGALLKAGKTAEAAKVGTTLGHRDSPFPDAAALRAYVMSPEAQGDFKRWKGGPQAETTGHHVRLGGKLRAGFPEGWGEASGAFVNMEAVPEKAAAKPAGTATPRGDQTATLKRGSRHSRTFTGTADVYETDAQTLLEKMYANYPENAKRDAIEAAVKSGAAAQRSTIQGRPEGPQWASAVKVPVDIKGIPRFDAEGEIVGARTHRVDLWFKDGKVARDFRNAFATDLTERPHGATALITGLQLAAPTDAVAHGSNWAMVLGGIPEGRAGFSGAAWDALRQTPGLDLADAGVRFIESARHAVADDAAFREAHAKLFRIGAARAGLPEPATALGKKVARVNPLRRIGEGMHAGDAAVRAALLRVGGFAQENGLMAPGEAELRKFITSTLGNYNPRMMGAGQRAARAFGLSPFIVAGRNFNRYALRRVLQMPAYKAADHAGRARLVANAMVGTAVSLALPSLINYARTGAAAPFGIPVGALYIKTKDDGTVVYYDPQRFTGLRRGARALGIEAGSKRLREGGGFSAAAWDAAWQAGSTAIHPWTGPAVEFGIEATTGRDTGGYPVGKDLHGKGGRGAQFRERVTAALEEVNPILKYLTDGRHPGFREKALEYAKALGRSLGYGEQTPRKRR